jgi:hypothetical protein
MKKRNDSPPPSSKYLVKNYECGFVILLVVFREGAEGRRLLYNSGDNYEMRSAGPAENCKPAYKNRPAVPLP